MASSAIERAAIINRIRTATAQGAPLASACADAGMSPAAYTRWARRFADAGVDGLADLPRSGRPGCCPALETDEAAYLKSAYLRSNLADGAGSMTAAARWAARNPASPLRPAVREAILRPRCSKHLLPAAVKAALRVPEAVVRRYRDPKAGQNDGIYLPGWLRMSTDGTRLLVPGERQVWDDGSVNFGVVVEWPRGFDGVNAHTRFRLARFQLLAGIDCQRDVCVGWSYVMHDNDAYSGADVCDALYRVWSLQGYCPDECVMEGGAWQSRRALDLLAACGVRLISAKGRPNQKLVEGYFNRLWTQLALYLPHGSIGRFRGEMVTETREWMRCRAGTADPRDHFPMLPDFLAALDASVHALNHEVQHSREYGTATPAALYDAVAAKGHPLPQGAARYALPVRERRVLARTGMVGVMTESPFGWKHHYKFASDAAFAFCGAQITVSFSPWRIREGAVLELAAAWQGQPAGTLIDPAAECISPAPLSERTGSAWHTRTLDARDAARATKRAARIKIGTEVTAYDTRGVLARRSERVLPEGSAENVYGFGTEAPPAADTHPAPRTPVDWAALEAAAGVLVS